LFKSYSFPLSLLYLSITIISIVQMFRIACYRHKLLSFQFGFVVLTIIWGSTRIYFFFFEKIWFHNLFKLSTALYWVSINFQFATFLFLVMFFISIVHKNDWIKVKKIVTTLYFIVNSVLATIFIVSYVKGMNSIQLQPIDKPQIPIWISKFRSIYTASVFGMITILLIIYGSCAGYMIYKENKRIVQRISFKKILFISFTLCFCFSTRCCYDLLSASSDKYMMNFSDFIGEGGYIVFILFTIWEIIPNLLVLFLFWNIPGKQSSPRIYHPVNYEYNELDRLTDSTLQSTTYDTYSTTSKIEEML